MTSVTKRFIGILVGITCFGSITFALSQSVTYKPWGVPDQRRDEYDQKVAEFDRQAALRQRYANQPRPIAQVSPPYHDFGWATPGETVQHEFTVRNTGTAPLQIDLPERLAEGVAIQLEPSTVPAGESVRCRVAWTLDPSQATPAKDASDATILQERLNLKTNDPLRGSFSLTVQARLRRELVVPDKLDFGKHDLVEPATVGFVVYSQLHSAVEVTEVRCDDHKIEWFVQPFAAGSDELAGQAAKAAGKVNVQIEPADYGQYSGSLQLVVRIDGREETRTVPFGGRVRPPIGFYGPNVDRRDGVDFGTVQAGRQHDLFVAVRSRADRSRTLQVLDVFPKELEAELTPLESEGTYRLRLSIPADCPNLRFNLDEAHGYVQIGDPRASQYSNWLPVYGCVADTRRDGR